MIPVPEAQAAYDRAVKFQAQPGDVDILIAASQEGGMPPEIVALGTAIKADKEAYEAYGANPTSANLELWQAADAEMRNVMLNQTA